MSCVALWYDCNWTLIPRGLGPRLQPRVFLPCACNRNIYRKRDRLQKNKHKSFLVLAKETKVVVLSLNPTLWINKLWWISNVQHNTDAQQVCEYKRHNFSCSYSRVTAEVSVVSQDWDNHSTSLHFKLSLNLSFNPKTRGQALISSSLSKTVPTFRGIVMFLQSPEIRIIFFLKLAIRLSYLQRERVLLQGVCCFHSGPAHANQTTAPGRGFQMFCVF